MDLIDGKVRGIEANVLDRYHEQQPLLKRSQIEAVTYLLKIYSNSLRDLLAQSDQWSSKNSWVYELVYLDKALEQSLRWVLKNCSPRHFLSTDSWRDIDDEAFSLML